jgi:hypothetical protein
VSAEQEADGIRRLVNELQGFADLDAPQLFDLRRQVVELGAAAGLSELEVSTLADELLILARDGVDPADVGIRNLASGAADVVPVLEDVGEAISDVQAIVDNTAASRPILDSFLGNLDSAALDEELSRISSAFQQLPDGLDAAKAAMKDDEGEILDDFGDFTDDLIEELEAQAQFISNIRLLETLGFDDLAEQFRALGIESAGLLADGIANPAELARAEAALDQFATEADLAYAQSIATAVAAGTASIAELITAIQSVNGLTSQAQIDVLFRSIGSSGDLALARAAVTGQAPGAQSAPATVVNNSQFFASPLTPSTEGARAAQAVSALVVSVS